MKANKSQIVLGLMVVLLLCATAFFRFQDIDDDESNLISTGPSSICVGINHPKSGLGLVCVDEVKDVLRQAVSDLEIPSDCLGIALPKDFSNASKVNLGERDGDCVLLNIEKLPGSLRLPAGGKFNVNNDTPKDLEALPGIGEVKAKAIVESREREGPFNSLDDLTRVKGIGEKTINNLKPWLEW